MECAPFGLENEKPRFLGIAALNWNFKILGDYLRLTSPTSSAEAATPGNQKRKKAK
jgi:hypothetical protein